MDITPNVTSVSQFLDLVNVELADLPAAVQGEITSLSQREHAYFTLTDPQSEQPAVLSCALWKFRLKNLPFELKEGMEVQVLGTANIYKPSGRFTFVVEHIAPVGEGALQKAFELLNQKLKAKGYFALERKRTLPEFPIKIGLLTSANGDALRDFRKHLGPFGFQVLHKDIRVEGLNAIPSIVEGLEWFNKESNGVEVLVLTRGGGSLESLQAFNSEAVAQAIFASKIPVISAVGHERDVTIADLVADVRASTPTDAGRVISEHWRLAKGNLDRLADAITFQFGQKLIMLREGLESDLQRLHDHFSDRVLSPLQQRFTWLTEQIRLASPENRLSQGYSIVANSRGEVLKNASTVKSSETVQITLHEGSLTARVQ